MASKAIYARDLPEARFPNQITTVKLYCPKCGESWSANRADYFNRNPDAPFRCTHCKGRPLCRLGVLRARWEPWRAPEGVPEGTEAGTSTVPSTSTGNGGAR